MAITTAPAKSKLLDVPYYFQLDNTGGRGYRECCGTSNAALANYLLGGQFDKTYKQLGFREPEDIYFKRLADYGDTTSHDANTACLKSFGIISHWRTNLSNDDYMRSIDLSIPMVLGVSYNNADGSDFGHVTLGIGYSLAVPEKRLPWFAIIHDPYGKRNGFRSEWLSNEPTAGKMEKYLEETFERIWHGKERDGWGRIVTEVKGVKTGLK